MPGDAEIVGEGAEAQCINSMSEMPPGLIGLIDVVDHRLQPRLLQGSVLNGIQLIRGDQLRVRLLAAGDQNLDRPVDCDGLGHPGLRLAALRHLIGVDDLSGHGVFSRDLVENAAVLECLSSHMGNQSLCTVVASGRKVVEMIYEYLDSYHHLSSSSGDLVSGESSLIQGGLPALVAACVRESVVRNFGEVSVVSGLPVPTEEYVGDDCLRRASSFSSSLVEAWLSKFATFDGENLESGDRAYTKVSIGQPRLSDSSEVVPMSSLVDPMMAKLFPEIDMRSITEVYEQDPAVKKMHRYLQRQYGLDLDVSSARVCLSENDFGIFRSRILPLFHAKDVDLMTDAEIGQLVDLVNGESDDPLVCRDLLLRLMQYAGDIRGVGCKVDFEVVSDDADHETRQILLSALTVMEEGSTAGDVRDDSSDGILLDTVVRGESFDEGLLSVDEVMRNYLKGFYHVVSFESPVSIGGNKASFSSVLYPLAESLFPELDLRPISEIVGGDSSVRKFLRYARDVSGQDIEEFDDRRCISAEDFTGIHLVRLAEIGVDIEQLVSLLNGEVEKPDSCMEMVLNLMNNVRTISGEEHGFLYVWDTYRDLDELSRQALTEVALYPGEDCPFMITAIPPPKVEADVDVVEIENRLIHELDNLGDPADYSGLAACAREIAEHSDYVSSGKALERVADRLFGSPVKMVQYIKGLADQREYDEVIPELDERFRVVEALLPAFIEQGYRALSDGDLQSGRWAGNLAFFLQFYLNAAVPTEGEVSPEDQVFHRLCVHNDALLKILTEFFPLRKQGYKRSSEPQAQTLVGALECAFSHYTRIAGGQKYDKVGLSPVALNAIATKLWHSDEYQKVIDMVYKFMFSGDTRLYGERWQAMLEEDMPAEDRIGSGIKSFAPITLGEEDMGISTEITRLALVSSIRVCFGKLQQGELTGEDLEFCRMLMVAYSDKFSQGDSTVSKRVHERITAQFYYLYMARDFEGAVDCWRECRRLLGEGVGEYKSWYGRLSNIEAEICKSRANHSLGVLTSGGVSSSRVPRHIDGIFSDLLRAVTVTKASIDMGTDDTQVEAEVRITNIECIAEFALALDGLKEGEHEGSLEKIDEVVVAYDGKTYNLDSALPGGLAVSLLEANPGSVRAAEVIYKDDPGRTSMYILNMERFLADAAEKNQHDDGIKEALSNCVAQWTDLIDRLGIERPKEASPDESGETS